MAKLRGLIAGAAGGLAGAALMGPFHAAASKVIKPPSPQGEDATEKVANAVARKATGRTLSRSKKPKAGQIVHFVFGASVGALYGLLAEEFSPLSIGAGALGALFGTAVYLGAHATLVPALGLAPSPVRNGPAREGTELASHLAYGLVTEAVRRVLT